MPNKKKQTHPALRAAEAPLHAYYLGNPKQPYKVQIRNAEEHIIAVTASTGEHYEAPTGPAVRKNGDRLIACFNACAGLRYPEKQIQALVVAIEDMLNHIQGIGEKSDPDRRLQEALRPFKRLLEK